MGRPWLPLAWTACTFGGRRPRFRCPAPRRGRRVAILYGGSGFSTVFTGGSPLPRKGSTPLIGRSVARVVCECAWVDRRLSGAQFRRGPKACTSGPRPAWVSASSARSSGRAEYSRCGLGQPSAYGGPMADRRVPNDRHLRYVCGPYHQVGDARCSMALGGIA